MSTPVEPAKEPESIHVPDRAPESVAQPEHIPLIRVREFQMGEAVRRILDAAAKKVARTADSGTRVSTSFVFFALAESGDVAGSERPTWTGDFLLGQLRRRGDGPGQVRDAHYERKNVRDQDTERSLVSLDATRHLFEDFAVACHIAEDTTGGGVIHARHLLAALLQDRPDGESSGVHRRLREMELDAKTIREEFLTFVVGWGDDDAGWERWLSGPTRRVQRLLAFDADRGSDDLIGIQREVLALATLIAARQVTPPLSIGLFGEWGSGKTFFMRKLQTTIATLAKEARESKRMQRDEAFYKRIVQIEFNAWHYVEGNLWASLVEHIFANLKVDSQDDATVTERLQRKLIQNLEFEQVSRDAALQREKEARQNVTDTKEAVGAAERERNAKQDELTRLRAENILRQFPFPELRTRLLPILASLGLDRTPTDVGQALHRAEVVLSEGGALVGPLLHAPDRSLRWIRLGAAILAPPVLAWATASVLKLGSLPQVASVTTGLATSLGLFARWFTAQAAWVEDRLLKVRDIQEEYDRSLKEALVDNDRRIAIAAHELEKADADYAEAKRRSEAAQRTYEAARKELSDATSVRLLASFIQDRASSADYRKHLGLLAVVRNDFEKLSGLIEDENWRLAPPKGGEKPRKGLRKFETLPEEEEEIESRINRIVLYIDDLDRCPPRKVVEVLQAVHLLLAFELFVVVVGVDARWIASSLRSRYRELLHTDDLEAAHATELIGRATAQDYLEKIFQVPFWIDAMDEVDCRRMVKGLLENSIRPAPASGGVENRTPTGDGAGADGGGRNVTADDDGQSSGAAVAEKPNVESLDIQDAELRAMTELAPLLGRSPRALKRFINVYRLVKATLLPVEYRTFIGPEGGSYRSVLFLLAVDSGAPGVAPTVFRTLSRFRDEEGPVDAPAALIAALEDESAQQSQSSPNAADFARVRDWLRKQDRSAFIGKMRQLSSWSARISRYSFGSEAGDAVRYTPISSAAGPPTQPAPAGTPPAGPSPRRRRPAPRETPRVP